MAMTVPIPLPSFVRWAGQLVRELPQSASPATVEIHNPTYAIASELAARGALEVSSRSASPAHPSQVLHRGLEMPNCSLKLHSLIDGRF